MKKSNKNRRFKVERKGYSIREVEDYIALEIERNEIVYNEQRERIDSLLNENQQLKRAVEEYKSREDKIAEAIIVARENADKMTAEIKLRYMMELDRLKLFRAKWIGVYEELKERYGFDGDALNVESVAISTKLEIERVLQRDFSLSKGSNDMSAEESFRLESERLSHTQGAVNDLKNKLIEAMKREDVAVSTTDLC